MKSSFARGAVWLRIAWGTVLGWLLCTYAYALPSDVALSQLHHTQWTVQSGAPVSISALTQTRDGYLWIAAHGRLFRFDGVTFERVDAIGPAKLPPEKVYALWASPRGGLWLAHYFGGATHIGDGAIRSYFVDEGLPHATINKFAEDSSGRLWVGTTRGLLRMDAGRWTPIHDAWQIAQVPVEDMLFDRHDTLWVVANGMVYFLRKDSSRFEAGMRLPSGGWNQLLLAPDGKAWLARTKQGITDLSLPAAGSTLVPRWRPDGFESKDSFHYALIDRDFNLWLSVDGALRALPISVDIESAAVSRAAGKSEPLRLIGAQTGPLMEDREGNIWIASSGGLEKLRSAAFVKLPFLQTSYGGNALAATQDGSVWIGGSDSGMLYRVEGHTAQASLRAPSLIDALHIDRQGTLWVGGRDASLHQLRGDRWIEWRPDDAHNAGGIQAIVSEPDGTLWVSVVRVGVYRVKGNRWALWGGNAALPREPATTLELDQEGRVWFGYVNSRLAVLDGDRVTLYGPEDGLSIGAIQVTAVVGRNVWVGGERGLSWFDGRRFHPVLGDEQAHAFASVNGIIDRADGDLWLNTSEGAALIPLGEVHSFTSNPAHRVRYRLFNYLDGMPGAIDDMRPLPSAVESTDGRIWFSTSDGVASLAPRWPPPNAIAPEVYIKSITVDSERSDVQWTGAQPLQLPSNPHVLHIAYTALSFAIPERVHFRYRLEGSDIGWQDAGMRREAYFTGLPPGNYRFQVIASNDAGIWNETGASLSFVIPPTFVQSREFLVLCIAAATLAVWLLFVMRMRRVKAELQSHNEERLLERERIARDLHDTFLQAVQGLVLKFQSAAERIPEDEPARKLMEDALDRADAVLAEGRDKVSDLRAAVCTSLPEAVKLVGNELSHDYDVSFYAEIDGAERALDPLVQEEAFRIATEALTNAFRHAHASRVGVVIAFGRRRFEIRVTDNGCAFDVSRTKPGRWGLKGMHERAERIRGRIAITSQPGVGTTVELRVPAHLAYLETARWRLNWPGRLRLNVEDLS